MKGRCSEVKDVLVCTSSEDLEATMQAQNRILKEKEAECLKKQAIEELHQQDGIRCSIAWDGAFCWPSVPAGTQHHIFCPAYIHGFDANATASRYCGKDGKWFFHEEFNSTWSNYSLCSPSPFVTAVIKFDEGLYNSSILQRWLPAIKSMSQLGYSISLATLLVAFFILASLKKLRCPRNMLHMHLFVSFIMRAFMALLKDSLFIEGVGLPSSIVMKDGQAAYMEEDDNWECKAITSLWQYFIMANYSWILMEGLYLHNLIFLAPFSDSSAITLYVALGWGLPVVVVTPWIIARATSEDTLCWTTYANQVYFLIIRIPIVLSIVLNFLLFLNIVRVLLLKIRSSMSVETRKYRYRKWAKSTLVLVPLFGVHYMLFLGMSYAIGVDEMVEIVWLFCDQLFASFQGFFVAVLYCLLNGEVRSEMGRKFNGCQVTPPRTPWSATSLMSQSKMYFSRGRSSYPSTHVANPEEVRIEEKSQTEMAEEEEEEVMGSAAALNNRLEGSNMAQLSIQGSTQWSYCPTASEQSLSQPSERVYLSTQSLDPVDHSVAEESSGKSCCNTSLPADSPRRGCWGEQLQLRSRLEPQAEPANSQQEWESAL